MEGEIVDVNEDDNEFEWFDEYEEEDISSDFEYDSEDEALDDLITRSKVNGPRFDPKVLMRDVVLEKAMIFNSWKEFKWAVKDYAISQNKPIYYKISDTRRCEVRCEGSCLWRLWCSKVGGSEVVQIRTLNDEHTCNRKLVRRSGGAKWLCDKILNIVRLNTKIKPKEIAAWVDDRYGLKITANQAYRARKEAKNVIEVDMVLQYARLRDYGTELLRTNPQSTVIIQCAREQHDDPPIFKRIYICLEALKMGFLNGCRPFIGLDGCFLKTPCGGQLLTATGQDGNNGIFPIAWAVVETESEDSWDWFLSLLMEDLGGWEGRHKFTFMSDQQKGLIGVFERHFEGVEHRFCVRHLHVNFKKDFTGELMHKQFWACAYAQTIPELDAQMENLRLMSVSAVARLLESSPKLRSRAHFGTGSKNHNLTNNISESYNSKIRLYREKNIITMFEELRMESMRRITHNRLRMLRHNGIFVPMVQKKLDDGMKFAGSWESTWSGDVGVMIFQVTKLPDSHVVNLELRSCSCRFWDLTGIPCVHAISAIGFKRLSIDDFVSEYYTKETYLRCYGGIMYPIPSMNYWPRTGEEELLPPPKPKKRGRPKVNRRKEAGEYKHPTKIKRVYPKVACSRCLKEGHNKRKCEATTEEVDVAKREHADAKKKVAAAKKEKAAANKEKVARRKSKRKRGPGQNEKGITNVDSENFNPNGQEGGEGQEPPVVGIASDSYDQAQYDYLHSLIDMQSQQDHEQHQTYDFQPHQNATGTINETSFGSQRSQAKIVFQESQPSRDAAKQKANNKKSSAGPRAKRPTKRPFQPSSASTYSTREAATSGARVDQLLGLSKQTRRP